MIGAVPQQYLCAHRDVQGKPRAMTPEAFAEYFRCYHDPACIRAVYEDYRARVTVACRVLRFRR